MLEYLYVDKNITDYVFWHINLSEYAPYSHKGVLRFYKKLMNMKGFK